jgi:hypothetical protein
MLPLLATQGAGQPAVMAADQLAFENLRAGHRATKVVAQLQLARTQCCGALVLFTSRHGRVSHSSSAQKQLIGLLPNSRSTSKECPCSRTC